LWRLRITRCKFLPIKKCREFDDGEDSSEDDPLSNGSVDNRSQGKSNGSHGQTKMEGQRRSIKKGGKILGLGFKYIGGIISPEDVLKFRKSIFRMGRGNILTHIYDISMEATMVHKTNSTFKNPKIYPGSDGKTKHHMTSRAVFVLIYQTGGNKNQVLPQNLTQFRRQACWAKS
jgi:hypothetical protein